MLNIIMYFIVPTQCCHLERKIILYITRPLVVSDNRATALLLSVDCGGRGRRARELKKELINNCRHCRRPRIVLEVLCNHRLSV